MACRGRAQVWAAQDLAYYRSLEAERINQSGATVEYYSLNRGTHVDALYGEPTNDPLYGGEADLGDGQKHEESWNFCPDVADGDDTLTMPCTFEYQEADNRNPMVRPEGKIVEYDAVMTIAWDHWECYLVDLGETVACILGRTPKEGDVCYCFEEWWDVVKVGKSGYVMGTSYAVGYRFELKARDSFTPDRKVDIP